jgi:hypothetical protein
VSLRWSSLFVHLSSATNATPSDPCETAQWFIWRGVRARRVTGLDVPGTGAVLDHEMLQQQPTDLGNRDVRLLDRAQALADGMGRIWGNGRRALTVLPPTYSLHIRLNHPALSME